MTVAASLSAAVSLEFLQEVFRERCEARAILYAEGELELHEAVDVLQEGAKQDGLIAALGQDAVQAMMAEAFSARWPSVATLSPEEISEARLRAALAALTPEERDEIAFKPSLKKEATDRPPSAAKATLEAVGYLLVARQAFRRRARRHSTSFRNKGSNMSLPRALADALAAFNDEDNEQTGTDDQTKVLPPPSSPMAAANIFVRQCMHKNMLTLRHWRAGWWMWRTTHWVEVEERYVRSILYRFTEHALYLEGKNQKPWAPTRRKIGDLLDALAAICGLDNDIDQPSWLDGQADQDGVIVSVHNGLLDVERRRLLPHTAQFFNQTSVPFDFDPKAPEPRRWLSFLGQLWPEQTAIEHRAEIDVLAEWFGYIVSGRTDLHKIMLMVGPTRGGKGAIARVLAALIGRKNVAGPTLNSLSGEFGLAPLIGKSLAVVSDARFAGKDASIVVERLLSISGEDTLTVNRKYRDQWTGKLPSRLHVLSNELPKLGMRRRLSSAE
jgi:hypothetical protein